MNYSLILGLIGVFIMLLAIWLNLLYRKWFMLWVCIITLFVNTWVVWRNWP